MSNPLREKIKRALWPHMYKKDYFPFGIHTKLMELGKKERELTVDRVMKTVIKHFKP